MRRRTWQSLSRYPDHDTGRLRASCTSLNMSSKATASTPRAVISSTVERMSLPEDAEQKAHHNKYAPGYRNPWSSWNEMSPKKIIWEMIWRRLTGKANRPDTTPPTIPVRKPKFLSTRDTPRLRATWLGHACYLVEFPHGLRVLFDPVFTSRCSPFSWLGPKRYTEIPCRVEDIPIIDLAIISHNHYDHLSYETVITIKKKNPNTHFFVPLGNKAWFESCGIHNVTELDWWESRYVQLVFGDSPSSAHDEAEGLASSVKSNVPEIAGTIHCTPSQHMSARSAFDRARTLWASWCVESGGKRVWFAGDSGYRAVPEQLEGHDDYDAEYADLPRCPAFSQIGNHRGPFDLGLIPIGAYLPRWIMSPMHANPFDSVDMFRDTGCKRALGMHWGTFVLTEEDVLAPPKLLKAALKQSNVAEEGIFDICDIGETREF